MAPIDAVHQLQSQAREEDRAGRPELAVISYNRSAQLAKRVLSTPQLIWRVQLLTHRRVSQRRTP